MGTDRHENYTISSDFQGPTEAHRTPQETRCFYENSVPISGRADSRDRTYKEKITLPGSPVDVSELVCVPALGPEGPISVSGWEFLTPFLFSVGSRQTRDCLRFGRRLVFGTDFSDPL
ncbi:hypothetical protein JTE90_013018 [Oedothorax gibbosus]|uniref:Uncharacterized protein n=1 Tax=Oedothorax gibbosus TaxID=931172 RepID=A0AAV6TKF1_9ARAC|nr:hypothetical protein JTE90_013018 [Oedothorax gibbosus]